MLLVWVGMIGGSASDGASETTKVSIGRHVFIGTNFFVAVLPPEKVWVRLERSEN
jgi:hypothetical protein